MKNNIKLGLCSAVAALSIATSAHAFSNQDAIRYSTDGGAHWVDSSINPNLLDSDGDGLISVHITAGGFDLTVVSSQTYPFTGNQASPDVDLNVQGKSTSASGNIIIEFSTVDFSPIPSGSYFTTFSNKGGGVAALETTRVGTGAGGNAMFASGGDATTIGGAAAGTYFSNLGGVVGQSNPYSLTMAVAFSSSSANVSISSDSNVVVPDGGNTLMLLGSALSVLGLGVFRKSRKA